jgi:hypothetical protein
MSEINIFWGWKLFDNKVLIPKDYTILPKIFEAEYSILSALSFIEYVNDQSIVDIRRVENMIINRLNNSGNFIVYNNYDLARIQSNTYYLNELNFKLKKVSAIKLHILNDPRLVIINNLKDVEQETSTKLLKLSVKKGLIAINSEFK